MAVVGAGFLRFSLASLVLASHLGHSFWGHNPGVVAVVVFYMLAGHVVARLWARQSLSSTSHWARLRNFYRDRLLRIFPQYLLVLLAAGLIWATGRLQSPFVSRNPDASDWVENLLVVPLSYFMYSDIGSFTLVPVAWSLGVELQFYMLAPALLSLAAGRQVWVLLCSLAVFALAQVQYIDAEHFGYRLLPGVLFVFMLGAWRTGQSTSRWLVVLWAISATHLAGLWTSGTVSPYLREVSLGLVLGIPLMAWLQKQKEPVLSTSVDTWRWVDRWLGKSSYGVFLWHFPVMWVLGLQPPDLGVMHLTQVWGGSVLLAILSHKFIEQPVWARWRQLT